MSNNNEKLPPDCADQPNSERNKISKALTAEQLKELGLISLSKDCQFLKDHPQIIPDDQITLEYIQKVREEAHRNDAWINALTDAGWDEIMKEVGLNN